MCGFIFGSVAVIKCHTIPQTSRQSTELSANLIWFKPKDQHPLKNNPPPPPPPPRLCHENWPWNSWKTNRAPHNIFYSGAIHSARPTKIIISPTLPFTTNRESEFIIGPPSSFTSLITHFHPLFAPFFIASISNFMAFYMSRKCHDLSPKFQTVIVC